MMTWKVSILKLSLTSTKLLTVSQHLLGRELHEYGTNDNTIKWTLNFLN